MSYVHDVPQMAGIKETGKSLLDSALDIFKAGAKQKLGPPPLDPAAPGTRQPMPYQSSFLDRYGTVLLLGGLGVGAVMMLKRR